MEKHNGGKNPPKLQFSLAAVVHLQLVYSSALLVKAV